MTDYFIVGLVNVIQPHNLLAIVEGAVVGLFVGSMPGLSATMAIALLVPLTFGMAPETGLSMLASLYMASQYAGSITAILVRTPGTPAAAATVLDGYPMAASGQAGRALGVSLTSSFVGGLIGSIFLLAIAPVLGRLVVEFGPVELFSVAVLGLTIVASLAQGSATRGMLSGVLGLLLGCVGMNVITGTPRFTFGILEFYEGISFVACIIGLFSIPQAIRLIQSDTGGGREISRVTDRILPPFREFVRLFPNILRSSVIGLFVGLVPGTGGDKAAFFAYNEAKRWSKFKDKFGTGIADGIAAPEAANNAVVPGALVPTITLGIPGSGSTAVLMGALLGHGILPGPNLMTDYADVTYTLIWAVFFSTFVMLFLGLGYTRVAVFVTKIPSKVLGPLIIVLCVVGAFAISNSVFDVYLMLGFGFLGYVFDRLKIPLAPMVLGVILAPLLDGNLHRSLILGHGSYMIFLQSPLSATMLGVAALSIMQSTPLGKWAFQGLRMVWRAGSRPERRANGPSVRLKSEVSEKPTGPSSA